MLTVINYYLKGMKKIINRVENAKENEGLSNLELYMIVEDCVTKFGGLVSDSGERVQKTTRVVDGHLFPVEAGKWCKLLVDGQSFNGFVWYTEGRALRVVIDRVNKNCEVTDMEVEVVRGKDVVEKRLRMEKEHLWLV